MEKIWFGFLVLGLICWTVYGFNSSLSPFINLQDEPLKTIMMILPFLGLIFFGIGGYIGIKEVLKPKE